MKFYLVGGAVRDRLLGLPVKERDWVVVGATEEQMLARGFTRVPADFPVFIHPESGEEYALARTETKTGPGYKGFSVDAGPHITLEQDLLRRDLTINALAEDEAGELIDPFEGAGDLRKGVLRHVSHAFVEDPVRLLRTARFAARFDFRVAGETSELMRRMAASGELRALQPERIWKEMEAALTASYPWRFFKVLHSCGALAVLLPELAAVMGEGVTRDGGETEPMGALKRLSQISADPAVRFATVMREAAAGIAGGADYCSRLRAPREYCDLLELAVRNGELYWSAAAGKPEPILRLLKQTRAEQQPERFQKFRQIGAALWPTLAGAADHNLERALRALGAVSASELKAQGLEGAELGAALDRLRLEAISSRLGIKDGNA